MLPLADIFNHKASVVELAEGYEVHGAAASSSSDSGGSDSGIRDGEGDEGEGKDSEEADSSGSEEGGHLHLHQAGCNGDHRHGEACTAAAAAAEEHGRGGGARQALPAVMGSREASIYGLKTGVGRVWVHASLVLHCLLASPFALPHPVCLPASCPPPPAANGLHLGLQMAIVDRDEETLELLTPSGVPAGQEVHNT